MIFNFRIDRTQRDFLKTKLISENIIYQGWGKNDLADKQFSVETESYYNLKTKRIPNNLKKIRTFVQGDILIVPHFPSDGCMSILVVEGNYPNNYTWQPGQVRDLNHGIKIKEAYGLNGTISIYHYLLVKWYGKLSGMRLPITEMRQMDDIVHKLLGILRQDPDHQFEKSTMTDYLENQTSLLLKTLQDQLYHLDASRSDLSFEKVCENLIEQYGYECVDRNCYDGKGGDADLIFLKKSDQGSPFETGDSYLFVQIKKHRGETDEQAIRQLTQIMQSKLEYAPANACAITLADTFSPAAQSLADDTGIKTITGPELCRLLISG
ncbi:restriction endonuclease [Jeotgalibacillus sp. R-1-5s-1]|uniref:restriction endonuclease n=1 Tax=Jeotgalibacillus sp. R-1-5s-1 TaxID=2555897 RepID=UPI00106A67BF|nr:restriction endonuclease [Jeotgalibacillus sp. R-1-5s-1]TFD97071.1 restriction endonuclease [Jeotgalibacillus sp. R-1-5s-1]